MIIVILSKMLDHSSVDIRHYFKLYKIFFFIWLKNVLFCFTFVQSKHKSLQRTCVLRFGFLPQKKRETFFKQQKRCFNSLFSQ